MLEGFIKAVQEKRGPDRLVKDIALNTDYSDFLPDAGAFENAIKTQLADLMAQIPAGEEAFNADLASRGTFQAGEATKGLYSQVYAPIARAGASAIAQSRLGFEQARMSGVSNAFNSRLSAAELWLNSVLQREAIQAQKDAASDSAFGDFVSGIASVGVAALL